MKEIAVTGRNGHVLAEVLSALLHQDLTVNAYVDEPLKLMATNDRLSARLLDTSSKDALRRCFDGYDQVVMTFDDDLRDHDQNTFVLDHYYEMINAAHEAGVKHLIVVGSPQSEAFFTNNLKRRDDVRWTFISTEGDYAHRTSLEFRG